MKTPALLLAMTGVLAAGACAPMAPAEDGAATHRTQRCFYADQVDNFQNGPKGTVYVRALTGQVFELKAAAGCNDLDDALVLGLEAWGGGSTRLCNGDWAIAHLPASGAVVGPCRVQVVRGLSTAELDALDPRYKP